MPGALRMGAATQACIVMGEPVGKCTTVRCKRVTVHLIFSDRKRANDVIRGWDTLRSRLRQQSGVM